MRDPFDHVELDHDGLGATPQGELLECAERALSQVCVPLFLVEHSDENLDKVRLLEQVATTETFRGKRIHESHRVLKNLPWT